MEERGRGSERWSGAITNLTEMASNLESLQKLLIKKAVFVDDDTFAKASLSAEQARTIKVLEQRVETLERELDAAITAAAHARSEKRQAEAAQKAAELRAQEVTKELENTTIRRYIIIIFSFEVLHFIVPGKSNLCFCLEMEDAVSFRASVSAVVWNSSNLL
ncbi:uncharacterized protein LOC129286610 isoform X1 [Prosopis cineraria]|uniref:uncharacterized protein LOC129286610 isoform X1 n=1 Tax=Prosopis cineraria TaxID=364024 RepID=UPI00241089AA|nr:uncharacterized protein LOC129286610 isoform X1 [Prosopis cineraria]